MKHRNNLLLLLSIVCIAFLSLPSLHAQDEGMPGVKSLGLKTKQPTQVAAKFSQLLANDEEIKSLASDLQKKGFKGSSVPTKSYGHDETFQRPDGKTASVEMLLQDFEKQGSSDLAALGVVKLTAGDKTETYSFSLIAPNGDFSKASERLSDKQAKVHDAHSWWTCFNNKLKGCGTTCLTAITTCPISSWTTYVACVILKCAGCATKALACCTCDCGWWCKWAAGCCER